MTKRTGSIGLRLLILALFSSPSFAEPTVGTLALDGLSFVSFQDQEVLSIPAGSTLRFHFGAPASDGSIPFTLGPEDVAIEPIPMPGSAGTLRYTLAGSTSGWIRPTPSGRRIDFTASVAASLESPDGGGTFTYVLPFTTESAEASNAPGTTTVEATGMRLVEGAWYVQLVGATTNRTNAFPKPGAAIYTVLSGRFDRLP
jgi:hypothetical protein